MYIYIHCMWHCMTNVYPYHPTPPPIPPLGQKAFWEDGDGTRQWVDIPCLCRKKKTVGKLNNSITTTIQTIRLLHNSTKTALKEYFQLIGLESHVNGTQEERRLKWHGGRIQGPQTRAKMSPKLRVLGALAHCQKPTGVKCVSAVEVMVKGSTPMLSFKLTRMPFLPVNDVSLS